VIHVSVPGEVDQSFAVPGIGPALKLLDQCAANLGELWGIPKEQQKRVVKPAKLINRETLFNSGDYPVGAFKKDVSGKTVVRYFVDGRGVPSECLVLKPSGSKDLDSRSCAILMSRARFEPARDINDKPMRSVAVLDINWLLMN
jgi:outer membrane biosynthesis protein TonB